MAHFMRNECSATFIGSIFEKLEILVKELLDRPFCTFYFKNFNCRTNRTLIAFFRRYSQSLVWTLPSGAALDSRSYTPLFSHGSSRSAQADSRNSQTLLCKMPSQILWPPGNSALMMQKISQTVEIFMTIGKQCSDNKGQFYDHRETVLTKLDPLRLGRYATTDSSVIAYISAYTLVKVKAWGS